VPRTIYAVIDAQAQVTEADETNNQASLNVSGMDLEVSYRSGTVLGDGSVRVVANVKNLSSPASSRLDLDLWPEMNPGPQPLGSVTIEPLEPGESLDVTLELPPGSQGPGDKTYRLVMDEAGLAGDVEQENNEALFVLHSSAAPHIAIFNGASTAPADSNSGTFAVGHAAVGSSVAQTFTIQNTGMADLTDLAVTLVPSGSYTVSQPALNTLSPNATTTFTVTFNPTDEGFQTAVLHIASNDEAHNPLDIAVTGTGVTPLLANDIFNSRMSLGNSPTVDVSGNNAGAMMEPGESSFGGIGGASVWHEWTAPASGWVTIHTAGSSFDTVMGIFTGTTLAGLTELGHNDVSFRHADFYPGSDNPSRLVFYAEVGTIYQIVVQGRADSDFNIPAQTGDFKLHIAAEPVPPFRVTALTLAPSLADVTNGSRSVIEQIGAASSTPLAGAGSLFSVQLLRPDASSSGPWVDFSGNERVAGDASSGTYLGANSSSTAAWIPQYALAGKWSARVQCSLNGRFYRWTSPGNDLVDDNYILPPAASSTLNVINRGVVDSVPPTLVSVSGVPETPLNVGNGDVTFNIVLNIMDTLSGFNYGFVSANSASTGNTLGNNGSLASFDYFNHRTSGDQQSGTYTVPVTIPAGTANGTYYIALELNDVTFNRSDYTDNPAGDPPGTRISPPGSAVVTFQVTGGSNVPGIAVELSDGTNIGGPEVGAVAVGSAVVGQSTSRTFTVRNSGTANLTGLVLSPDLGMPNSNDFAIGVLGATTLAPGATTNFTVTFTPTALGSRIGGVGIKSNITSNDGNWNPFFIHFAGTGTASLTPREAWRQTFFGSTANSGNAADTFDYDHDGLPNLMEWACHLNPTTASTLPITATRNGASFEFTYTRSVAAVNAGAVFTVEWSDTLSNDWQVNGVTENILSDDNTVQRVKATIPAGSGSRRFAHLKVTGPP